MIGAPLCVVTYPPMMDLPFHATAISILRHYTDPAFGFRAQFELHPLASPYLLMYAIGAAFALVLGIAVATKLAVFVMLALLPAGLAVLLAGMKKSPLWAALGAPLAWTGLTHMGFVSFVGATGLYVMALGVALLVLDAPTRGRRAALAGVLVAVLFTHPYRFPFACLGVLLAGVVMYPTARRFRPLLLPLLPSLLCAGAWMLARSKAYDSAFGLPVDPHLARIGDIGRDLLGGFTGAEGKDEARRFAVLGVVALVLGAAAGVLRGKSPAADPDRRWVRDATTLVAVVVVLHVGAYLALPESLGGWWYVYQREIAAAALLSPALLPRMPAGAGIRLGMVAAIAVASARIGSLVVADYRQFEDLTADFRQIVTAIPPAPRLCYVVMNNRGTSHARSPFVHLPAWVQAERGGALSFHFVSNGFGPIRYRSGSPDVPPPVPPGWEFNPGAFEVLKHGRWFDHFLVRREHDPSAKFAPDPGIRLAAHVGSWWLYERVAGPAEPGAAGPIDGPKPVR